MDKEIMISEQQVKRSLNMEYSIQNQKKCVKKVSEFYNNNEEECMKSLNNYKLVNGNIREFINGQKTISKTDFNEILNNKKSILILTANDIENNILIWNLRKINEENIKSYLIDDNKDCININFCHINDYNIIHHHVGKTGDEYTRRALNDLTKFFSPTFIVLLGICYGFNYDTQTIGQVNISEQIVGVRINFRDMPDSDEIVFEPEIEFEEKPNEVLTSTITKKLNNCEIKERDDDDPIKFKYGRIVSANSLMSCKIVKDSILSKFNNEIRGKSQLIGGEMEACGIFKSNYAFVNDNKFDRWIVIKSICDWGESKNSLVPDKEKNAIIKDSLQAYAMMNSCKLLSFLIKNTAFR